MTGALLMIALAAAAPPAPVEGRADSPVRVVVYENLQCSDCAAFRRMLDEKLLPRYGGRVAFVHRDFPLAKHAWARKAAIAARFFDERKLGLEFRRTMLFSIRETTAAGFEAKLAEFARAKGVPEKEALAALENPVYAAAVEKDFQEGVARGVAKTPTVFVDGTPFIETFTFEEISKGIEDALAQAH
jgi:protein-disulfide isomerase